MRAARPLLECSTGRSSCPSDEPQSSAGGREARRGGGFDRIRGLSQGNPFLTNSRSLAWMFASSEVKPFQTPNTSRIWDFYLLLLPPLSIPLAFFTRALQRVSQLSDSCATGALPSSTWTFASFLPPSVRLRYGRLSTLVLRYLCARSAAVKVSIYALVLPLPGR